METISVDFDGRRIGRVVEKMGRGAYYMDHGEPLPEGCRIRTYSGVPNALGDLLKNIQELNLGGGIVRVRRGYGDEDPCLMVCSFQFYNGLTFTIWAQGPAATPPR